MWIRWMGEGSWVMVDGGVCRVRACVVGMMAWPQFPYTLHPPRRFFQIAIYSSHLPLSFPPKLLSGRGEGSKNAPVPLVLVHALGPHRPPSQ